MNFKGLFVAAALSASWCVASAAPGDPIALLPAGPGVLAASFTQFVDDGGSFDTFNFTPASFSGLVSVVLTSVTGPVTFSVASIDDQDFGLPANADPSSFSFEAQVTGDQPLTVTVASVVEDAQGAFSGTGTYNVAVTAAVPESQTWALMAGGLFLLGLASKARVVRQKRSPQTF